MSQPVGKTQVDFKQNSNSTLDVFRHGLNNLYRKYGDSNEGLHQINMLSRDYYRQLQKSSYYAKDLKPLFLNAAECEQYYAFSVLENDDMKLSVHMMPKGTSVPMHSHPNQFCLIMLESGTLQLEQQSIRKHLLKIEVSQSKLLSRSDISVGLPIHNNRHALKAMTEVVMFISLRVTAESNFDYGLISRLFNRKEASSAYLNH